ncbi:SigE family RNA polymerase sigma factor, partial [Streptomyces sp. NPDC059459]
MGTVVDDAASAEFHAFFERHYAELSRLAHLLTGGPGAAPPPPPAPHDTRWHPSDRGPAADPPRAYARRGSANNA